MCGWPEQDRGGASAVATHGLSVRYGSETALAAVDLRVPEGAVYILIGPNDPVVRNRMLAQLAEHLADTPTTVVLATHHIHEVESLADHVGVLRQGWQAPRELEAAPPSVCNIPARRASCLYCRRSWKARGRLRSADVWPDIALPRAGLSLPA